MTLRTAAAGAVLGTAAIATLLAPAPASAFERTQTCYLGRPLSELGCADGEQPAFVDWRRACVPWRIDHTTVGERFFPIIIQSFQTWNEVAGSYINLQYAGLTNQSAIGYDCRTDPDRNVNLVRFTEHWNRSNQIIALTTVTYHSKTGEIYDADIELNTDRFALDDVDIPDVIADETMDLQSVMTHEVGHFIGLDHSSDASYEGNQNYTHATMYANTSFGSKSQRVLDDDDIQGISAIYPIAEHNGASCPPIAASVHTTPDDFDPTRTDDCGTRRRRGCRCDASTREDSRALLAHGSVVLAALVLLRRRRATRSLAS